MRHRVETSAGIVNPFLTSTRVAEKTTAQSHRSIQIIFDDRMNLEVVSLSAWHNTMSNGSDDPVTGSFFERIDRFGVRRGGYGPSPCLSTSGFAPLLALETNQTPYCDVVGILAAMQFPNQWKKSELRPATGANRMRGTTMPERFWCLKDCPLFEKLSDDEIEQLEERCRLKTFFRGSLIDLPGLTASAIYLVVSGRVKISHLTEYGKESILAFVQPGEIFGELAVVDESGNEDFLEAVENSVVLLIPVEVVRSLMERHAGVSLAITKLIGMRRKRIERRLKSLMFHSARERLIHLLLDLVEDYGVMRGNELHLRIRLSHQDLASLIGSSRETVTVALGDLKVLGHIRLERRRIILTHPDRLASSVQRTAPLINRPFSTGIPMYVNSF